MTEIIRCLISLLPKGWFSRIKSAARKNPFWSTTVNPASTSMKVIKIFCHCISTDCSLFLLLPLSMKSQCTPFSGRDSRPTVGCQVRKLTTGGMIRICDLRVPTPILYPPNHCRIKHNDSNFGEIYSDRELWFWIFENLLYLNEWKIYFAFNSNTLNW